MDKITDSEQGYVDDPNDKGGKTKYGIAENREWKNAPKALGIDNDVADIKKLSKTQADYFYYTTRFSTYRINDVSDPSLQKAIIDQSVLTPGIINRNLKKALNSLGYSIMVNSSKLTNSEISVLNSADGTKLLNAFLDNQTEYYKSLDDKKHEKGWLNRVKTLRPPTSKK